MEQTPTGNESWLPRVRLSTLGHFRFERLVHHPDQAPSYSLMTNAEWQGKSKALTLLKVLLCQHNRRATRDKLMDLLWSEDEQHEMKDIRAALKTTAVVLRDILRIGGEESLLISLLSSDELMLAEQQQVWVDADAFETLIHHAIRTTQVQDALPLWEQAYTLAQGEFLEDEPYSEWATARRDTLHGKMGQCVHALADLYVAHQRLDLAQDILWDVATATPVDEDALCRLLALLEQQERYHAAWQLYTNAKQECVEEGCHLTPRVHALAKRIRGKLVAVEPYTVMNGFLPVPSASDVFDHSTSLYGSDTQNILSLPALSDILSRATTSIDCAAWFGLKQAQILACIHQWIGRRASCHELQGVLHHMIDTLDEAKTLFNEDAYKLSRRQALIALAMQPLALFAGFRWEQQPSSVLEELLPHYAASITACWRLLQGRELSLVSDILASYLPTLTQVAHRPSKYQKTAAMLVTQAYRLHGIVALHRNNINAVASSFEKALYYSEIAEHPNFHVSALISLGYHKPNPIQSVDIYEKGLIHVNKISPLLRSRLYVELAVAYAQQNRRQEALQHLLLAQEFYPESPERDPSFVYAEFSPSSMILEEGLLHLGLTHHESNEHDAQRAWKTFERVEISQSGFITPERIRVEIINYQAKTALALRSLESFCLYLERGARGAKALESEKRRQEAIALYKEARRVWPEEPRVKELADLLL